MSFAGADFIESEVNELDLGVDSVILAGRPSLRFDAVSFDIGREKVTTFLKARGAVFQLSLLMILFLLGRLC